MRERVAPGAAARGWVEVGEAAPGSRQLVFGDITTDGYRTAGGVVLNLPAGP